MMPIGKTFRTFPLAADDVGFGRASAPAGSVRLASGLKSAARLGRLIEAWPSGLVFMFGVSSIGILSAQGLTVVCHGYAW